MNTALRIHVNGIVQGVGFRPFVYRTAKHYLVSGWVLNAADGVEIHAEGDERLVDQFVIELSENAPAAAQVSTIEMDEVPLEGFDGFEIRFSDQSSVDETTLVSPDLATCDSCVAELFSPENRRYRYPFINCTNCGPRFTIIERLPYDRPHTSMRDFPMCDACRHEYEHPENRRFHAQPDACFDCGPSLCFAVLANGGGLDAAAESGSTGPALTSGRVPKYAPSGSSQPPHSPDSASLTLTEVGSDPDSASLALANMADSGSGQFSWGRTREESDAILARAVAMLREGKILAVKGLGGFHLVCDAENEAALAELRRRKHRPGKAFAVMAQDVEQARAWAQISGDEACLLETPARPIVLLKKLPGRQYPRGLADGLSELGIMLPTTPLQHLLARDFGGLLVMTSGNLHDEPIQIDDAEACQALAGIADALIGNNRPILSRYDDSVARIISLPDGSSAIQPIRRARGYAPLSIAVAADGAQADAAAFSDSQDIPAVVFAAGPEQKNTFTLLRGQDAFVSQHIGDMENAETFDAWLEAKLTYERLFQAKPSLLACDLHPEYLASKWVRNAAREQGIPLEEVQHHHAHIAAVMAENKLEDAVCGIAFDGTGYGADGAIWGGEVLLANLGDYERFANFAYVPMPGGAAAVKHPLRMAYGALWAFDLLEHPAAQEALAALGDLAPVCEQMIERGLNAPMTSSVGRLFDAASALLGICREPSYEGEPAIMLEAHMSDDPAAPADRGLAASADGDAAGKDADVSYHLAITKNVAAPDSTAHDTSVFLFDAAPAFAALLDDLAAGVPTPVIAWRFHNAFVEGIVQAAQLVEMMYGIRTVVLAGGVFMNRYLLEHALVGLTAKGFSVAINRDLPPNDASVSFGQAVVAWTRKTT